MYKYLHNIFWTLGIEIWDLNQARLTCLTVFFGTFLVKNNVDAKRGHKIKKINRHIVVYEISDFCILI
jgi:hypothetical protein